MDVTLAQLQARCDGGQFTLSVVTSTPLVLGDHPYQRFFPATPGAQRVAVSWSAVFRGKAQKGLGTIVADVNLSASAQQAMLNSANDELNVLDIRLGTLGKPPGPALQG